MTNRMVGHEWQLRVARSKFPQEHTLMHSRTKEHCYTSTHTHYKSTHTCVFDEGGGGGCGGHETSALNEEPHGGGHEGELRVARSKLHHVSTGRN